MIVLVLKQRRNRTANLYFDETTDKYAFKNKATIPYHAQTQRVDVNAYNFCEVAHILVSNNLN